MRMRNIQMLCDLPMKVFSLILILFFLTACTSTMAMDEELEQYRKQALSKIDIFGCLSKGKIIASVGMFATPSCIKLHSDGGKICQDSSDCESMCTSKNILDNGVKANGFCQAGFGDTPCYNVITKGITEVALCMD